MVRIIHEVHHESLLLFATGLCRRFEMDASFANDLLQEFYYSVITRYEIVAKGYAEKGLPYLCQMIKNEIIDQDRKVKGLERKKELFSMEIPRSADVFSHCFELQSEKFLEDMSILLPAQDFQIMKLYMDGHSYDEIGEFMEMIPSTVGVRIHRAKKTLGPHFDQPSAK